MTFFTRVSINLFTGIAQCRAFRYTCMTWYLDGIGLFHVNTRECAPQHGMDFFFF